MLKCDRLPPHANFREFVPPRLQNRPIGPVRCAMCGQWRLNSVVRAGKPWCPKCVGLMRALCGTETKNGR